ncbi:MAG: TonB-dependent receptor plug domain-containing protein, partial [Bryobacteraceae bacterium]
MWTGCLAAEVRFTGRVVDETNSPIGGVRITVGTFRTVTALDGSFVVHAPDSGACDISAEHEAFFPLVKRSVDIDGAELTLVLAALREVRESVHVPAQFAGIDPDRTAREKRLTENQIVSIPYPATNNLRNAMRLLPGVTQDARGGLHIDGGAEDQALYLLDGFNVTDPLTGRFESRLSVESVRSIEVSTARFSPEFGKGSAGALAVRTLTGDDRVRYSATNFIPGVENHKGLQIGNWTPRAGVRGPIRRGRAWFSTSADALYDRLIVEELPKGEDRSSSWRLSNVTRAQVNLTPGNVVTAGVLWNLATAARTGLTYLDPVETTIDRRARQWFFHVKDQVYLSSRALIEFGYAANRTFGREIPQGHEPLRFTPDGKRGNFFVDATREASRDQGLASLYLPGFAAAGEHRIKVGGDFNRLGYSQSVRRTGFEHYRENGILLRRVAYGGSGALHATNVEASGWALDSWKIRPALLVDAGVRYDYDRLTGRNYLSPRLGVGWSPREDSTRVSGGYAVVYDASSLRLFTRPLDQTTLTTYYHPDTGAIVRGPAAARFSIDPRRRLRGPRYQSWSAGLEQRLPGNLLARADWLRKRGAGGFTYANILGSAESPDVDAIYELANARRDEIDS